MSSIYRAHCGGILYHYSLFGTILRRFTSMAFSPFWDMAIFFTPSIDIRVSRLWKTLKPNLAQFTRLLPYTDACLIDLYIYKTLWFAVYHTVYSAVTITTDSKKLSSLAFWNWFEFSVHIQNIAPPPSILQLLSSPPHISSRLQVPPGLLLFHPCCTKIVRFLPEWWTLSEHTSGTAFILFYGWDNMQDTTNFSLMAVPGKLYTKITNP